MAAKLKVGILGATGTVGQRTIQLLELPSAPYRKGLIN
jgi:aspartate-semialdehyde dehydrogenase